MLLLKIVLQEDQKIPAFSGYCKRVRFRQSDCQRCVDICPENAIALGPGPTVNDRCSGCGLCQTACPTEVFQDDVHTDQYLLSQFRPFLSKGRPPDKKQRLFIHCQQAATQNRHSVYLPCLGSITENFILGAALLGLDELVLTKGNCSRCRLKQGEQLLTNSIATFHDLSTSLGLQKFTLSLREKHKREATLSRRAFFSRITGKRENNAESMLSPKDKSVETEPSNPSKESNGIRPSPKREFLRTLLEKMVPHNFSVATYRSALPWANITIDETNCVTCGICVAMCPTGAISRATENQQLSHYFNASLCTNCRLCEEACPENVISFEQDLPLTDLLKDEANAVTKINLNACLICGEVIPAREGKICTTCDKRQMSSRVVNI